MSKKLNGRKRSQSLAVQVNRIEANMQYDFIPDTPPPATDSRPSTPGFKSKPKGRDDFYDSKGFWTDLRTLRWMRVPESSFKLLMIPVILYGICKALNVEPNPFEPMLFISYPVAGSSPDDPRYAKGPLDIVFLAYHIIFFSFIRQFAILKCIYPVARRLGINKQAKLDRFGEQAYCVLYYGTMGVWGTYIMTKLPTWWYQTEFYWIDYPHWDMNALLKRYYLMHFSYWIQQLAIMVLKIEKPRKDFKVLVAHHLVTLWLIGWSYGVNMTLIGNAVFVSMDLPDTVFALSKLFNYLNLERTKTVSFIIFIGVWTYFRHWLNIVMLYSVWTEFDLIPDATKVWSPPDGVWMVWWMKYQIFTPIFMLQLLNVFWYFLIWRVAYRTIRGAKLDDERSDDEGDGDQDENKED